VNKEDILCLFVLVLILYFTDTQGKATAEITLNMLSASMSDEFCYLFTEKRRRQSSSSCLFTNLIFTQNY